MIFYNLIIASNKFTGKMVNRRKDAINKEKKSEIIVQDLLISSNILV